MDVFVITVVANTMQAFQAWEWFDQNVQESLEREAFRFKNTLKLTEICIYSIISCVKKCPVSTYIL